MPEPKAQEKFTDPDSRVMKRAGGGFEPLLLIRPTHESWSSADTSARERIAIILAKFISILFCLGREEW